METATLTATQTETHTEEGRQFSYFDKCERCGAQAWYVAHRKRTEVTPGLATEHEETQELVFCKHHGDKHTPALAVAGWSVVDFTHLINSKPTDPSDDEF